MGLLRPEWPGASEPGSDRERDLRAVSELGLCWSRFPLGRSGDSFNESTGWRLPVMRETTMKGIFCGLIITFVLYFIVAVQAYRFRNPTMTETQLFLNISKALLFK